VLEEQEAKSRRAKVKSPKFVALPDEAKLIRSMVFIAEVDGEVLKPPAINPIGAALPAIGHSPC
jgi:hypothetical protein